MKVTEMTTPPVVGQRYIVPCVFAQILNPLSRRGKFGHERYRWWPVLLPSHEDSAYLRTRDFEWKQVNDHKQVMVPVYRYAEPDPKTPHHFHIDARFVPLEWYPTEYQEIGRFHTVVFPQDMTLNWQELECYRDMPEQRLFDVFGPKFIDDHRGKFAKCGRCPHKGVNLLTMPVRDGVITCPSHGLRFDAETMKCITGDSNG